MTPEEEEIQALKTQVEELEKQVQVKELARREETNARLQLNCTVLANQKEDQTPRHFLITVSTDDISLTGARTAGPL